MITAGYTVHYESIDSHGRRTTRFFKTLAGARTYAHRQVGETPEMGSHYAISGDGVGKITVEGASLFDLFPRCAPDPTDPAFRGYRSYEEMQGDPGQDDDDGVPHPGSEVALCRDLACPF